jgi:hypothetical protein
LYRTHTSYNGQYNWLYHTRKKNTCLHIWSLNRILVHNEYCTCPNYSFLNSHWRLRHSHTASFQEPWRPCIRNAQKSQHTADCRKHNFHCFFEYSKGWKTFSIQHLGCFKTNLNKTGIHWTPCNKRYFFDRTH